MTGATRNEAWWKLPGVEPQVAELVRVRSIGVDRLGDIRRNELINLRTKAGRRYPQARDKAAIHNLLDDAVANLQIHEPGLVLAAKYELGLLPVPDVKRQTSHTRRRAAAGELHVSWSLFRHDDDLEKNLLIEISAAIDRVMQDDDTASRAPSATPFVERYEADADLDELLRADGNGSTWNRRRLYFVVAEPGMGASSLVLHHLRNQDVARLPARTDEELLLAACRLLERYHRPEPNDSLSARYQLSKLLTSGDGPAFVIIDNVVDPSSLLTWLPERLRCKVVIVSRILPPSGMAPHKRLGPMTMQEARSLLATFHLAVRESTIDNLIMMYGRRPKLLAQIGRLLAEAGDETAEEFASALLAEPDIGLDLAAENYEESLRQVYARSILLVIQRHPMSIFMLYFLAFVGHPNLTERCLRAFIATSVGKSESAIERLRYERELQPLVALGLVQQDRDRRYLDPLTARLVRQTTSENNVREILAMVFLTLVRAENAPEITIFELLQHGWAEADVVAFSAVIFIAMRRFDVNAIKDETRAPRRPSTETDEISLESFTAEAWEENYFVLRGMGADASWVAGLLANLPQGIPTLSNLSLWMNMPESGLEFPPEAEGEPLVPKPTPQELAIWLRRHGLSPALSGRRLEHSEHAYTFFHLFKKMAATGFVPNVAADLAKYSDFELAHASYDIAKILTLHERFAKRGRAEADKSI